MTANPTAATPQAMFILLLAIACFSFAIFYLISLLSGWYALSKRFRAHSQPYGETRSAGAFSYSVRMRFKIKYNNVIRFTAADDALYLSMILFSRIGHPPLRIPWNEIQFDRSKFLWMKFIVLTLGTQERIPMSVSERMARKLGILERLPGEK